MGFLVYQGHFQTLSQAAFAGARTSRPQVKMPRSFLTHRVYVKEEKKEASRLLFRSFFDSLYGLATESRSLRERLGNLCGSVPLWQNPYAKMKSDLVSGTLALRTIAVSPVDSGGGEPQQSYPALKRRTKFNRPYQDEETVKCLA